MVWLPDDEKNFEDIFIRFDRMYERDRQTHRQTDTDIAWRKAALDASIARQKLALFDEILR